MHQYKATPENICHECKRPEIAHGNEATCESCANTGPCELIDDILMCASCQARDKEIKAEVGITEDNTKQSKVSQLVNQLGKEIPLDRRLYFVSEVTAIVDYEQAFLDTGMSAEDARYAVATAVEANIEIWKKTISDAHQTIRESQGKVVADQKYLNIIVPQLRAEEREKFKAYDISYKPASVSPIATATKPRMSAADKAYESAAKQAGVSVEQYKLALANAMKNVLSVKCTCAETPGICKVHFPGV